MLPSEEGPAATSPQGIQALLDEFSPREREEMAKGLDFIKIGLDSETAFAKAAEFAAASEIADSAETTNLLGDSNSEAFPSATLTSPSPTVFVGEEAENSSVPGTTVEIDQTSFPNAPENISETDNSTAAAPTISVDQPSITAPFEWRTEQLPKDRQQKIDAIIEDALGANPSFTGHLKRRLEQQFGVNSNVTRQILGHIQNVTGASTPALRRRSQKALEDLRAKNRAGIELSEERIRDREAFADFAGNTDHQLRPEGESKVTLSRQDGTGQSVTISRKTVRFLTQHVPAGDPRLALFLKLIDGVSDPVKLAEEAKQLLALPDPFKMGPFAGEFAIAQTMMNDKFAAFSAAQQALKMGLNRDAVAAALIPGLFPKIANDVDAMMGIFLDLLPLVGEIRSIKSAAKNYRKMNAALESGDLKAAQQLGMEAALETLGALPILGPLIRPAKAAFKRLLRQIPGLKRITGGTDLATFGRQAERNLPASSFREALGPLWEHFPASLRKSLGGHWSNMLGELGEATVTDALRASRARNIRTVREGPRGSVKVNLGNRNQEFDQVIEGRLVTHFGLFTRIVRDSADTAIEVKLGSSRIRPNQRAAIDQINRRNSETFQTIAGDGLGVREAAALRVGIHQVSPQRLERIVRQTFAGPLGDPELVEQAVKNIEKFRRRSAKENISLGQALTAVAIGSAIRAAEKARETPSEIEDDAMP